jgi:hypothetical protein
VGNGRGDEPHGESGVRERRPSPRRLSGEEILRLCLLGVLIVLIGGAIGYAGSWLIQAQYGARSEILYSLREDQPTGFLREDRNLTTQVVLIESRTVITPVALANGLSTEELADKVGASVAEGSEVIEIEVRDPDREAGLRLVDELTQRYLAVANGAVQERRTYLESQLEAVQRSLDGLDLTPGQVATLNSRRSGLLTRLDTLALSGPQARQLGSSYTTSDPVTPRRYLAAAAGALSALLIAAVVIALLAHRWRRR